MIISRLAEISQPPLMRRQLPSPHLRRRPCRRTARLADQPAFSQPAISRLRLPRHYRPTEYDRIFSRLIASAFIFIAAIISAGCYRRFHEHIVLRRGIAIAGWLSRRHCALAAPPGPRYASHRYRISFSYREDYRHILQLHQ